MTVTAGGLGRSCRPLARRPAHQEALEFAEHDLDRRRGSILIRQGEGGRRREDGMDEWGWENCGRG
jgi:hypothetical protein